MAVLECLQGVVGVSTACGATEPSSGLYVTDLPGISLQNIEATANAEQKNFLGVWEAVERRALVKLRSAALAEINKCFCISDISAIDCLICENDELFAIALWYLLGAELCYERIYSDAFNRFTTIDKKKAVELREDFIVDFQTELTNAVKAIDLTESECIDHPSPGGSIQWIESPVC